MNYNELQDEIKKRGLDISVITLRRYVKAGLIPEPKRKHFGRGKGEQVEFPSEAIAEAVATKMVFLKERFPAVELVKQARDLILEGVKNGNVIAALEANEGVPSQSYKIKALAEEWLKYYVIIKDGYDLNTDGYWTTDDDNQSIKFVADSGKIRETFKILSENWLRKLENLTEEQKERLNEEANKQIKALIKAHERK